MQSRNQRQLRDRERYRQVLEKQLRQPVLDENVTSIEVLGDDPKSEWSRIEEGQLIELEIEEARGMVILAIFRTEGGYLLALANYLGRAVFLPNHKIRNPEKGS